MFARILVLALAAGLISSPASAQSKKWVYGGGFLLVDASCPSATHILTPCLCDPPLVSQYVFSTRLDLNDYAGRYVVVRGLVAPSGCGPDLIDVRKVTVQDFLPPCPCPQAAALPRTVAANPAARPCGR